MLATRNPGNTSCAPRSRAILMIRKEKASKTLCKTRSNPRASQPQLAHPPESSQKVDANCRLQKYTPKAPIASGLKAMKTLKPVAAWSQVGSNLKSEVSTEFPRASTAAFGQASPTHSSPARTRANETAPSTIDDHSSNLKTSAQQERTCCQRLLMLHRIALWV